MDAGTHCPFVALPKWEPRLREGSGRLVLPVHADPHDYPGGHHSCLDALAKHEALQARLKLRHLSISRLPQVLLRQMARGHVSQSTYPCNSLALTISLYASHLSWTNRPKQLRWSTTTEDTPSNRESLPMTCL